MDNKELRTHLISYIEAYYGERCPDIDPLCPICKKYNALDILFEDLENEEDER